ncbi:LamG-like jellyroll fold domain-containing protein [Thermoproteota archaeon]
MNTHRKKRYYSFIISAIILTFISTNAYAFSRMPWKSSGGGSSRGPSVAVSKVQSSQPAQPAQAPQDAPDPISQEQQRAVLGQIGQSLNLSAEAEKYEESIYRITFTIQCIPDKDIVLNSLVGEEAQELVVGTTNAGGLFEYVLERGLEDEDALYFQATATNLQSQKVRIRIINDGTVEVTDDGTTTFEIDYVETDPKPTPEPKPAPEPKSVPEPEPEPKPTPELTPEPEQAPEPEPTPEPEPESEPIREPKPETEPEPIDPIGINLPPTVDAGEDQVINLAEDIVNLDATVSDDGLPNPPGAMATLWSMVSGPGSVTFGDEAAIDTIASFSTYGVYVLRLTADDSELNSSDDIEVTVNPIPNEPPAVDAGSDQEITLPDDVVNLDATVSDDGLPNPPGAVTTLWSVVSSPGSVTFGDAAVINTTATFSTDGVYTLRLTADDSELQANDTVTIDVSVAGSGNTHYVSTAGNDLNDGSIDSPWATIQHAADIVAADDTVYVRGGMYHQEVIINTGGTPDAPITFSSYPGETAILDGSQLVTDFVPCSSPEDCAGNPNWENIYKADIDTPSGYETEFIEGDDILYLAEYPNQDTVIPDVGKFIALTDQRNEGSSDTLYDDYLTQFPDGFFVGNPINIWNHMMNNALVTRIITSHNAQDGSVSFDPLSQPLSLVGGSNPDAYSISNNPDDAIFDKPGEFVVVQDTNGSVDTVYLWPNDAANINNTIGIADQMLAFQVNADYITIKDFKIRNYFSAGLQSGAIRGLAPWEGVGVCTGLTILNNEIFNTKGQSSIMLYNARESLIQGNYITNSPGGFGIYLGGIEGVDNNCSIIGNKVENTKSTCICAIGVQKAIIGYNEAGGGFNGNHANAIAVYGGANGDVKDVVLIGNTTHISLTAQMCADVTIYNNLILDRLAFWSTMDRTNIINNVILDEVEGDAFLVSGGTDINVVGNIIGGGGDSTDLNGDRRSYNIYTSRANWQSPGGWSLGEGEMDSPIDEVFLDASGGDYRLKADSPAVDASIDPSGYLSINLFPDLDWDTDIVGAQRPAGAAWDIGPYEFSAFSNCDDDNPVAVLIVDNQQIYQGESIHASASSSFVCSSSATITNYAWHVDGVEMANGPNEVTFDHVFQDHGTFELRLTITDSLDRTSDATKDIAVLPSAVPGQVLHLAADGSADDSSGHNNHGAWIPDGGDQYGDGVVGQAFSFDGGLVGEDSPHVVVDHSDDFDGTGGNMDAFSMACFVQKHSPDTGAICLKHTVYSTSINNGMLYNYIFTDDGSGGSTRTDFNIAAPELEDTDWHHIALTYDGAYVRVYIDGDEVGSPVAAFGPMASQPSRDLYIGVNPWADTLNGSIDDFRIYNRAISGQEVADLTSATGTLNTSPVVDAGADQAITLPNDVVNLVATISDDGLPDPPTTVTTLWSMVDGPGSVTFGDASVINTTANFSTDGVYILRLTADDGQLNTYDDIEVTIYPISNQSPVVNAGIDQEITLPDDTVSLDATVSDDGLPNPPGTVTVEWSKESGPGDVTFGDANAVDTTATFSVDGVYVLRLTANDSELQANDTVTIDVSAGGSGITYYIDYENGNDTNDGTSTSTPWQHAPSDANATGNPASATLLPGDTVRFKGSVNYYGSLQLKFSGTPGNPITYEGDGWGTEKAIIDGSVPLTGWTPCGSAAECGDNPNYESIYYTDDAPSGMDAFKPIFEGDEFAWIAQDPNLPDPHYFDDKANYHTVPWQQVTNSSVHDPSVLTQSDPDYYNNSYVAVWAGNNAVFFQKATSFDPDTNTIYFEEFDAPLYTDRDNRYSILNNVHHIDMAGETAFDPIQNRVYLWPRYPANLDTVRISDSPYLIDTWGQDYVEIMGFKLQKAHALLGESNEGAGIRNLYWGNPSDHTVIKDNEITLLRSMVRSAAIQNLGNYGLISNNYLHDTQKGRGITFNDYENVIIRDNIIRKIGRTGIAFMGPRNSAIIGNRITDASGNHGNGISVYAPSENILVANNIVTDSNSALTFRNAWNLTIINNIIDSKTKSNHVAYNINILYGDTFICNNMFLGSSNDNGLSLNTPEGTIKNNIVDGILGLGNHSTEYNIYTGLSWQQGSSWSPGLGEIVGDDNGRTVPVDVQTICENMPAYEDTVQNVDAQGVDFQPNTGNNFINVSVNDYIVFNDDGVTRQVISVNQNGYSDVVVDNPPAQLEVGDIAHIWKASTDFTRDYHHKADGIGIDAGVDIMQDLIDAGVVDMFPYYDFETDIEGNPRDDGNWDIGAYEYISAGQSNESPVVDAGADQAITLSDDTVSLDATVTDDGLPNPPATVTMLWSMISGPGSVTFGDEAAIDTTASFSTEGVYILRLTVDDGALNSYDEATITVNPDSGGGQLVAYYTFDGHTNDVTGNGHDGSMANGAYFVDGILGQAVYLDGVDDYVNLGDLSDTSLENNEVTRALWVRWVANTGNYYKTIFRDGQYIRPLSLRISSSLGQTESIVQFGIRTIENGTFYGISSNTIGFNWVHLAITYKDGVGTLYINGQQEAIISNAGTLDAGSSEDTYLGAAYPNATNPTNMVADELRIYNYALTASQIAELAGGEPPDNQAPYVNAGLNQAITLPDDVVNLDAMVSDDGLPDPPTTVTTLWSVVSGPGSVTFGDEAAIDTTASFSTDGVYVLRLTADDGELISTDDMQITVNPEAGSNQAPTVDAGSDQEITLPDDVVNLDATVSDDGLPDPPTTVTTLWSVVSSPGSVTIADAYAIDTTATFSDIGTYVLRLTADDSELQANDTVTIDVINSGPGNTYYIDYENGNDSNNGTSTSTPWKHAPGDSNATGNAAVVDLEPDDTVSFKGGVRYCGEIRMEFSGNNVSPIRYVGDEWGDGDEKAIIDGSEPLMGWTACGSAGECGGNPNWQNMYYTDNMPTSGMDAFKPIFERDQIAYIAQDPNLDDPHFMDYHFEYHKVPPNQTTQTSIQDHDVLTQDDEHYYDGSYVAYWTVPNFIHYLKITSFNPNTDTITFEPGGLPYEDRENHYSILNHLDHLDRAGEISYHPGQNRIYYWPRNVNNLNDIRISESHLLVDTYGHDYIDFEGFKLQGAHGLIGESSRGIAIKNTQGDFSNYVNIRDNEITLMRGMAARGAIEDIGSHLIVDNNYIHELHGSLRSMLISRIGQEHIQIKNNVVKRVTSTGITVRNSIYSSIIGNTLSDNKGAHANGMSFYIGGSNILIADNYISGGNFALNVQMHNNVVIMNNIFDVKTLKNPGGGGSDQIVSISYDNSGFIGIFNNIILGSSTDTGLIMYEHGAVIKNNIVDGHSLWERDPDRSHNIYAGLHHSQDSDWSPAQGEIVGDDNGRTIPVSMQTIFENMPAHEDQVQSVDLPGSGAVTFLSNTGNNYINIEEDDYIVFNDDGVLRNVISVTGGYADVMFEPFEQMEWGNGAHLWKAIPDGERDYHHKSGGIGIDTGTDIMSYITSNNFDTLFPYYDFTTDFEGNPRDGTWDIGPYEYQGQGEPIIADHQAVAEFDLYKDDPAFRQAVLNAKQNIDISYGHSSHGSQILAGINFIDNHIDPFYGIDYCGWTGSCPQTPPDELSFWARVGHMRDAIDLGNPDTIRWIQATRDHLDNEGGDRTDIWWSWCGQLGYVPDPILDDYLNGMDQLQSEYPNVTFVYMTGHPNGQGNSHRLHIRNEAIRQHCIDNNRVLFDFADIQQWDLDGNNYGNNEVDECNWCEDYCNANPDIPECLYRPADYNNGSTITECAHSHGLNCALKGKVFWWMMARLGGWNP